MGTAFLPQFAGLLVHLACEACGAMRAALFFFAGAGLDERERAGGVLRVVLVELGELEADRGVVDGAREPLEIGERAGLVAARLGDLGSSADARIPCPARERLVGDGVGAIVVTCTLQRARYADEILRVELRAL